MAILKRDMVCKSKIGDGQTDEILEIAVTSAATRQEVVRRGTEQLDQSRSGVERKVMPAW